MIRVLLLVLLLCSQAWGADTECATDDDHNGTVDFWCAGSDADNDGVASSLDCDDNNYHIRNDNRWYQKNGDTTGHLRKCNSDGTWDVAATNYTATGLNESTGSGRAFYVDCSTGNDSNPCTWASPCATFKNFVKYYNAPSEPASYIRQMAAGDVAYVLNCSNLTTTYSTGDVSYPTGQFWLQNTSGTSSNKITLKAYPGHEFTGAKLNASGVPPIKISGVQYFVTSGIDTTGIYTEDGAVLPINADIGDMLIHGADGSQSNNVAGAKILNGTSTSIHHSDFYDNYDHTNFPGTTENNSDVVIFDSPNVDIRYNRFTHSALLQANCLKLKHNKNQGLTTPRATLIGNVCLNATTATNSYSWGFGMAVDFENNRTIGTSSGSPQIYMADLGGATDFSAATIIRNNYFGSRYALDFKGSVNWNATTGGTCTGCGTLNNITFDENVVDDLTGGSDTLIDICRYGSDTYHTSLIGGAKISVVNNCYDTAAAFSAGIFANSSTGNGCNANEGAGNYNTGASYSTFAGWTGAGYDSGSVSNAITVNTSRQVTAGCDASYGWADAGGAPTPTPTPTPSVVRARIFPR